MFIGRDVRSEARTAIGDGLRAEYLVALRRDRRRARCRCCGCVRLRREASPRESRIRTTGSPSSSRSSSTTRSTTCAPKRICVARSSQRMPGWSACSRPTGSPDGRQRPPRSISSASSRGSPSTPGAVQRLTALFTQAKFSHHDVDATMKEDAIDALEQVRDELRGGRDDASLPVELSVPSAGSMP